MWATSRFWLFGTMLCVYLEPPVIAYLGDLCPDNTVAFADRLNQALEPFHDGLASHPALVSLWLVIYYGAFLVHGFSVIYKKVDRNEGDLLLPELALLLCCSVFFHAASCGQRSGSILSTGQLAAETLLAPTHAVPSAWFAPRLAWSLLQLQQRRLKGVVLALVLVLVWLCGAVLRQLDTRTFMVTCAVAWTLVPPRVAADAYKAVKDDSTTKPGTHAVEPARFQIGSETGSAEHSDDETDPRMAPYTGETEQNTGKDGMTVIELDHRPHGTPRPHVTLRPVDDHRKDDGLP